MEEIKLILDSSSNQETNPAKNIQIVHSLFHLMVKSTEMIKT